MCYINFFVAQRQNMLFHKIFVPLKEGFLLLEKLPIFLKIPV